MTERQLEIIYDLFHGKSFTKKDLSDKFKTTERSIQRDFTTIRTILANKGDIENLDYNAKTHRFALSRTNIFNQKELLIIIKILLANRSLPKLELMQIKEHLFTLVSEQESAKLKKFVANETIGYQEPKHQHEMINSLWKFKQLIENQISIDFTYQTDQGTINNYYNGLPVAITLSTYYFYIVIYYANSEHLYYYYRADRFKNIIETNKRAIAKSFNQEQFFRYEESKTHTENPWMQIGNLQTVTFTFYGILEAALDNFPAATVVQKNKDGSSNIRVRANWSSLKMWLLSQGAKVKLLSPISIVTDYQKTLQEMVTLNEK